MSWFQPRRPNAAFVVSVVALIAALSGTAYAGIVLGRNSVGTRQLRNRAVTTAKIHNGAVTAVKLKKGIVVPQARRADVANSAGAAVTAGHASSADTAGHALSADTAGHASTADNSTHANFADSAGSAAGLTGVNIVRTTSITDPAGTQMYGQANCPSGQYVVGGGSWTDGNINVSMNESWPTRQAATDPTPDAWGVYMNNNDSSDWQFSVYAICVSGSATAGFKGIHAVHGN